MVHLEPLPAVAAACDAILATGLTLILQFTLLVAVVALVDWLARTRLPTSLRYALWLLPLVRLFLPPNLSSPTSLAYWIRPLPASPRIQVQGLSEPMALQPTATRAATAPASLTAVAPAAPWRTFSVGALLLWSGGSVSLLGLTWRRQRQVQALIRASEPAPTALAELLQQTAGARGWKHLPALRLSPVAHSPAICGLWRPVLVVPCGVRLTDVGWRHVFEHELVHLQRGDLWINAVQVLAQILWWWNPLVAWTNGRIRELRESAVDEAVMLSSRPDSDEYPDTLVLLARQCLLQPRLSINFLGIMETPSRLERRVRRLIERPLPRTARLGVAGWAVLAAVAAAAVPMGVRPKTAPAPTQAYPLELAQNDAIPRPTPADKSAAVSKSIPPGIEPTAEALFTRTYRLNATALAQFNRDEAGVVLPNDSPKIQSHLVDRLRQEKILFPQTTPGETPSQNVPAIFLNTAQSLLFARAPHPALDRLEKFIQQISIRPQQILFESVILEVPLRTLTRLQTDGPVAGSRTPFPLSLTNVTRLTVSQNAALQKFGRETPGVTVLASPKVTTLSDRPAQIAITDPKTIVFGKTNVGGTETHLTREVALGLTLDLMGTSEPSSPSLVRLTAQGRLVEFLGYQDASNPSPILRTNQSQGDSLLHDGQSIVLPLHPVTNTVKTIDRVAYLGDLPLIGRFFTKQGQQTEVIQGLIVITPRLIDPAGKPVFPSNQKEFDPEELP